MSFSASKPTDVQIWYGDKNSFIKVPFVECIPDTHEAREILFSSQITNSKEKIVKVVVNDKHECFFDPKRKVHLTLLHSVLPSLPPLYHFYHLWVAGNPDIWPRVLNEHIDALICSGLLDHIQFVYVGLVGPPDQCEKALNVFAQRFVRIVIIANAPTGFEQVTLSQLTSIVKQTDACVLYCHNKGCLDVSQQRDWWRQSMTSHVVYEWRTCLRFLTQDKFDVAGIHWINRFPHRFFGGNFWWATQSYLQTLGPIKHSTRFDAENWIGENPTVKAIDLKPGWPHYPTADNV